MQVIKLSYIIINWSLYKQLNKRTNKILSKDDRIIGCGPVFVMIDVPCSQVWDCWGLFQYAMYESPWIWIISLKVSLSRVLGLPLRTDKAQCRFRFSHTVRIIMGCVLASQVYEDLAIVEPSVTLTFMQIVFFVRQRLNDINCTFLLSNIVSCTKGPVTLGKYIWISCWY